MRRWCVVPLAVLAVLAATLSRAVAVAHATPQVAARSQDERQDERQDQHQDQHQDHEQGQDQDRGVDQDAPAAANAPAWPARAFEDALGAKGVVIELPGLPEQYASVRIAGFGRRADAADHAARLLERVGEAAGGLTPEDVVGEGPNAVVFRRAATPMPQGEARSGDRVLLFASLRADAPLIERTWMAYEPTNADTVRGLAVIIPGTFGYPPELYKRWSADLRARGWSVLRLLSQPSRFTEFFPLSVAPGEEAAKAALLAASADQRTAECAYAVEAAADHVEALDRRLVDTPRVVLGFSGGAILQSAVVARQPGRYASAVYVAGGANAAAVAMDSQFMRQFIRSVSFRFTGEDPDAQRRLFESAYLRASTLDAFHAATWAAQTRSLVIDATRDEAVPPTYGDLLWRRLGRPERRSYPTGHVGLFLALPEMVGSINDWLQGRPLELPRAVRGGR